MCPLLLPLALVLIGADATDLDAKALQRLNGFRKAVDLPVLTQDADLSMPCLAHAEYLLKNFEVVFKGGLNVHDEDPKLPGYSVEGRKAAKASVISHMYGRGDVLVGIDIWMGSFYHRVPLLDPSLAKVGIGFAGVKDGASILVVDSSSGKTRGIDNSKPIVYPVKDQTNVPRIFCQGFPEAPNPLPNNGDSKKAGYPITVSFYQDKVVIKDVTATLEDEDGKEIEVWLSWQEKPAVKGYGRNSICLIPQAPLKARTTYTATVAAKVNNRDWKTTWSFTTGQR